jgi:hypothetical protein
MARFQITIIQPSGYVHSECFKEVAETLMYGLKALGHDAKISRNFFSQRRWNVVLGAHLLSAYFVLPARSIIYNLEQCDSPAFECTQKTAGAEYWWDYSANNILKCPVPSRIVPIGYVAELTRIKPREQDIDVLFYGSINERRKKILKDLVKAGLRVHAAFNCYGLERDELISRAKVVLNVHYYESKIFEIVRCSYLMANRKCIVSEQSKDTGADLTDVIAEVPYEHLVQACKDFCEQDDLRHRFEKSALDYFSQRDEREILKAALADHDWEIAEAL